MKLVSREKGVLMLVVASLVVSIGAQAEGPPFDGASGRHSLYDELILGDWNYFGGKYDPDGSIDATAGVINQNVLAVSVVIGGAGGICDEEVWIPISVSTAGTYTVEVRTRTNGGVWSVGGTVYGPGRRWGNIIVAITVEIQDESGERVEGSLSGVGALCWEESSSLGLVGEVVWSAFLDYLAPDVSNWVQAADLIANNATPVVEWNDKELAWYVTAYLEPGQSYNLHLLLRTICASCAVGLAGHVSMVDLTLNVDDVTIRGGDSTPPIVILDEGFSADQNNPMLRSSTLGASATASDAESDVVSGSYHFRTWTKSGGSWISEVDWGSCNGYDTIGPLVDGVYRIQASAQNGAGLTGYSDYGYFEVDDGPNPGNDISIASKEWEDPAGDGDGLPEAGENVELGVYLHNESGNDLSEVRAVLSSNLGNVQISDNDVGYGTIQAAQTKCSGEFDMFLDFASPIEDVQFTLHVTYEKDGRPYYQDLSFYWSFYPDGDQVPYFDVASIVVNQSGDDAIVDSGESVNFDIYLRNVGSAPAYDIQAKLSNPTAGIVHGDWHDYPDLAPEESAKATTDYDLDGIPQNFSDSLSADITIQAAGGFEQTIPSYSLFTVRSVPYIRVQPTEWNFGTTGTADDVVVEQVEIANTGSAYLNVSNISISPTDTTDTTWTGDSLPWTISSGQKKYIDVTIDTGELSGKIERTLTVESDGRLYDSDPPSNILTITGLVSGEPQASQVPGISLVYDVDVSGNIIVWMDPSGGDNDIYAFDLATGTTHPICTYAAHQFNPRVGDHLIAWYDARNWDGTGDMMFDIYAYTWDDDISNGQPIVVSTDPAYELLVGVDGRKIAFTRNYDEVRDPPRDPRNLYLYDADSATETAVTSFSPSGNTWDTIAIASETARERYDFGDGVISWLEYTLVQDAPDVFRGTDYRIKKLAIGTDSSPVQILSSNWVADGPVTNDGIIAWTNDEGSDDQVWVWQGGSPTQVTYEEVDHADDDDLATGSNLIVYDKGGEPGLFYWDLDSNDEAVLTTVSSSNDCEPRMDGNLVVWLVNRESIYYAFLKQADISVSSANILFSDSDPYEGELIDVTVTVQNLAKEATAEDITVQLYDGDPHAGGTQLGSDQIISGGIVGRGEAQVTFINVPVGMEGEHEIYVLVSMAAPDNPSNNTAIKTLNVQDTDTFGPEISDIEVGEFSGDGDGTVGDDEQLYISWILTDPSGISATTLSIDGQPVTLSGDYYAILDPLAAGEHELTITATDADTSPADAEPFVESFTVVPAEEIVVLDESAEQVTSNTTVDFGIATLGQMGVSRTFIIQNGGEQTLTLGDGVAVPTGFSVSGPVTTSVGEGDSTHFTITMDTGSLGTYSGEVSLENSDADQNPFTFTVAGEVVSNQAPVLSSIDYSQEVDEGDLQEFTVSATDIDGHNITLTATNLPSDATFIDHGDGTGTFSWQTEYDDAGTYSNVTFTATDDGDPPLSDSESITITVRELSRAPELIPIGDKEVDEGDLLEFTVSATDPDGDDVTLSAESLPEGATFTDHGGGTGTFSWQTEYDDADIYSVTFTATDDRNPPLSDSEMITITVNDVSYTLYAPWFGESVGETDGFESIDGRVTFVCLRNASDEENLVWVTYLSPTGDAEGPHEIILPPGAAVTWTPHSTVPGAETPEPEIENASFGAGSVKIEATQPVVGRVIMIYCDGGTFLSMAAEPLVKASSSLNDQGKYEVYAPWFGETVGETDGFESFDGYVTFVCLRNVSDDENVVCITYLSPDGAADEPHCMTLPPGGAVTWTPHSTIPGAETPEPEIENASFRAGSVKIEATQPVVGRVIMIYCYRGMFLSMGAEPLVEKSEPH